MDYYNEIDGYHAQALREIRRPVLVPPSMLYEIRRGKVR